MSRSRKSGSASRRSSPLQLLKSPSPLLRHTLQNNNNSNNSDNNNNVQQTAMLPPLPASMAEVTRTAAAMASAATTRDDSSDTNKAMTAAATRTTTSAHSDVASLTSSCFSRVELTFQLSSLWTSSSSRRGQRSSEGNNNSNNGAAAAVAMLYPRDIGSLLLWCVPTSVPLVEAPRAFFVRNRSRVRDVVVVCIRGWSAEMMLCDAAAYDGTHHSTSESSLTTTTTTTTTAAAAAVSTRTRWSARVCAALLAPVRSGQCWARGCTHNNNNNSSSSGCGVQFAPLRVSGSTWHSLAYDIMWRYGRPNASAPSNGNNNSNNSNNNYNKDADSTTTAATPAVTAVSSDDSHNKKVAVIGDDYVTSTSRGVGAVFKRARALFTGTADDNNNAKKSTKGNNEDGADGDDDGARSAKRPRTTHDEAAPAKPTAADTKKKTKKEHGDDDDDDETSAVWSDAALLRRYALHMPEHEHIFAELGYTLQPLDEEWCSFADDNADTTEEKKNSSNNNGSSSKNDGNAAQENDTVNADANDDVRVYALDCEMVLVGDGVSALARGTLVDVRHGYRVVLDELVKPSQPVVDYLTRYSGVDAAALSNVTTTLPQFQRALRRHITPQTFLVGHSLENDLRACKVVPSCYVLDTAWLYPHPSQLPYKNALRFLAHRYLGVRIQHACHDSSEDACVSARLAALKLTRGETFGVRERVNILDLMCNNSNNNNNNSSQDRQTNKTSSTMRVCVRLYDDAAALQTLLPRAHNNNKSANTLSSLPSAAAASVRHSIDAVPVRDDEDATRKVVRALRARTADDERHGHHRDDDNNEDDGRDGALCDEFCLTWVQLHETAVDVAVSPQHDGDKDDDNDNNGDKRNATANVKSDDGDRAMTHEQRQLARVAEVNERVLRIIDACRDDTIVLIVTSPPTTQQQQQQRQQQAATATTGDGKSDAAAVTATASSHECGVTGACFAFVKDHTCCPPPPPQQTQQQQQQTTTAAATQLDNVQSGAAATAAVDKDDVRTRLAQTTPPACQAQ